MVRYLTFMLDFIFNRVAYKFGIQRQTTEGTSRIDFVPDSSTITINGIKKTGTLQINQWS